MWANAQHDGRPAEYRVRVRVRVRHATVEDFEDFNIGHF